MPTMCKVKEYRGVNVSDKWMRQARLDGMMLNLRLHTPMGEEITFHEMLKYAPSDIRSMCLYLQASRSGEAITLQLDQQAIDVLENLSVIEIVVADLDSYVRAHYKVSELKAVREALGLTADEIICDLDENGGTLKYSYLLAFDRAMLALAQEQKLFAKEAKCLFVDADKQILVYERAGLIFAFNFSPYNSYDGYFVNVPSKGEYVPVLSTDDETFGGFNRIATDIAYTAEKVDKNKYGFKMYLPSRTAVCLVKKR